MSKRPISEHRKRQISYMIQNGASYRQVARAHRISCRDVAKYKRGGSSRA